MVTMTTTMMMMMMMMMLLLLLLLLLLLIMMMLMLSLSPGDSLTYHNNQPFSTRDQDHDGWSKSCAAYYDGAWWFKKCIISSLNGRFGQRHTGIRWNSWKGNFNRVIMFSQMKMRPM